MLKGLKRGFTLIELLIVIAIIGILAGVVVYSTSNATTRAKRAADASTVSSALNAAKVCLAEKSLVAYANIIAAAGNNICSDDTYSPGKWPTASQLQLGALTTLVVTSSGVTTITPPSGYSCSWETGSCTPTP